MKARVETARRAPGSVPIKTVQVELDENILDAIPGGPTFKVTELEHAFSWPCRVPDVWRYALRIQRGKESTMLPLTEDPDVSSWYANCSTKACSITSWYADRPALDALKFKQESKRPKNAASVRVFLLLLESPHAEEYDPDKNGRMVPRAPAQNVEPQGAGYGIEHYWPAAINALQLEDGYYLMIVANPVPYQCSLATVMPGPPISLQS